MKAYTNGKIYTVNENRDWAEAVVTDGNRIVYVGDDAGANTPIWSSLIEMFSRFQSKRSIRQRFAKRS